MIRFGRTRTAPDAALDTVVPDAVLEGEAGSIGIAQFSRFVLVGVISSALYAVLYLALDGLGSQVANLAGAIASTLLANELHRRLTFRAGGRVSWLTAQIEGGGLAVVGLVATSLALSGAEGLIADTTAVQELGLLAVVTGLVGLVRFVALRFWVFKPEPVGSPAADGPVVVPAT